MRPRLPLLLLLAAAIGFGISLVCLFPDLPDRPATHFGASGQPNGWMTRNQYAFGIVLLGFGLPALVSGICFCLRFFPASLLNVPQADYWRSPANYPEACRILLDWSFCFGAVSLAWTGLLNYQVVLANRATPPFPAPLPVVMLTGMHLVATGALIGWLLLQFRKAPRD